MYTSYKFLGYFFSTIFIAGFGGAVATINYEDKNSTYLFRELPKNNGSSSGSSGGGSNGDTFSITAADSKNFSQFTTVPHSYKELLSGTTSYNSGNYLIYYGSEACSHCMELLFSNENLSRGNLNVSGAKMSEGALMKAYKFISEHEKLSGKNLKIIFYEDTPPSSDNRTNDDLWTLPWSTWSSTDLKNGKISGEYKRYDKSAVEFRKIMDYAISIFGDGAKGTPTIIIYKDGKPNLFSDRLEGLPKNSIFKEFSWKEPYGLMQYVLYHFNKDEYDLRTAAKVVEEEVKKEEKR